MKIMSEPPHMRAHSHALNRTGENQALASASVELRDPLARKIYGAADRRTYRRREAIQLRRECGRRLDREYAAARRDPTERRRQRHAVSNAEGVRGNQPKRSATEVAEFQIMNSSGGGAGPRRIHEDRRGRSVEQIDERRTRAVRCDHLAAGRRLQLKQSCDFEAGGVIAERAADTDDPDHSRSTSNLRKWVEQEMHGS
jgi:hypothetical protein